jgi:hypothetical protein
MLLVLCCVLYLKYDRKGYFLGIECLVCNGKLPYQLKPEYKKGYLGGLKLLDKEGFELVGSGFRFENMNSKILNIISYGYSSNSLIVKCTDSLNTIRYLISYETKYLNDNGSPDISFKSIEYADYEKIKGDFKWLNVDENEVITVQFIKFLFGVGIILLVIFMIKLIRGL